VDGSRFDDLVKRLAGSPSRRALLSAPAVATLASVLAERPDAAFARKKRRGKKKKKKGVCTKDCVDKECGSDGCGGDCGTCVLPKTCNGQGRCACVPNCGANVCGNNDGCGGSCGQCFSGETCQNGSCVCETAGGREPGALCDVPEQCCPYGGAARFCSRSGKTFCFGSLKACRYGHGGKCFGDCDCEGETECQNGVCQCPSGRAPHPAGGCCPQGRLPCGNRCCFSGDCLCFGGLTDCRCINFP
jgi:hypothetical protein